jgi:hypothetical protein
LWWGGKGLLTVPMGRGCRAIAPATFAELVLCFAMRIYWLPILLADLPCLSFASADHDDADFAPVFI